MNRPVVLSALALALLGPASRAADPPPAPLTLRDAIQIALRRQPQIAAAQAQTEQAKGQAEQAKAQYFPSVTPTYQYQDHRQTSYGVAVPEFDGTVRRETQTFAQRGGQANVSVRQNLYDGGRRETANAQARQGLAAARLGERDARQRTILTVTQAYYGLLKAQDQVRVAQAQADRARLALDITQAQVEAGTAARKDIYQAQADLANAQVTLLQAQTDARTAETALKTALGVESDAPIPLAPAEPGPPDAAGPTMSLEDAQRQALANRPDLLQQKAAVEIQAQAARQARREAGVSLSGDYLYTWNPKNDTGPHGTDSQLTVTATYPLFDAGRARGAVRAAEGQRAAAAAQADQIRLTIRQDVEQAYLQREAARQRIALARTAVEAAQVNFDAVTGARKEGIGTVLDETTAQVSLTQAQTQSVAALYDFYLADAALRRAVGANDEGL